MSQFNNPHNSLKESGILVPGDPVPFSDLYRHEAHVEDICTCQQTHINKKILKKELVWQRLFFNLVKETFVFYNKKGMIDNLGQLEVLTYESHVFWV